MESDTHRGLCHIAMKKPTKTKAVITSGLIPKRGRAWAYGYADLAALFQTTQGAIRQLVYSGRLCPDDLHSIIGLYVQWFPQATLDLIPQPVVKEYASAIPTFGDLLQADFDDAWKEKLCDPDCTCIQPSSSITGVDPMCKVHGEKLVPNIDHPDCSCMGLKQPDPHCSAHGHRPMWKTTQAPGFKKHAPDVVCVVCLGGFTCHACAKWNDTEESCPCQKCQNCEGEGCDACLDTPSEVAGCIGCTSIACPWCAPADIENECSDCGTTFVGHVPLNLKPLCETCLDKPAICGHCGESLMGKACKCEFVYDTHEYWTAQGKKIAAADDAMADENAGTPVAKTWGDKCVVCKKLISENCEHVYADAAYTKQANSIHPGYAGATLNMTSAWGVTSALIMSKSPTGDAESVHLVFKNTPQGKIVVHGSKCQCMACSNET